LGKLLKQHAPLAAAPEQVQYRTKHLEQRDWPGTDFLTCIFQQRLDGFKFFATDVEQVIFSYHLNFSRRSRL